MVGMVGMVVGRQAQRVPVVGLALRRHREHRVRLADPHEAPRRPRSVARVVVWVVPLGERVEGPVSRLELLVRRARLCVGC